MMTEAEAYDGLRVWAAQNGMNAESVGGEGWKAATVRGLWVITPAGRTNTVYVVGPDLVRPVHPSREKLGDVLTELAGS
jgi:hypothetical protein